MSGGSVFQKGFNGLKNPQPSLPATWYSDASHHATEVNEIWSRSWLPLCRSDEIRKPCAWHASQLVGRNIIVIRKPDGDLSAFHNVCRHRGAELCAAGIGQLDRPLLVCPYHQWSYDLTGRLITNGTARSVDGFDRSEHALVALRVEEWGGYVFVNLDARTEETFEASLGAELAPLRNWPLDRLEVAHREVMEINCNWKVFWENFNECLHCPGIHPDLCELVPIYGRGIMVREDDPGWRGHAKDHGPLHAGGLREGAESWTRGGRAQGATLPGLAAADIARGHTYAVALPSLFAVGHADYVRSVRVRPLGPERMELVAEWLLPSGRVDEPGFDLRPIVDFAKQVLAEDAAACEMNQRGLSSAPFASGTLMQEEYEVHAFHQWVRSRLGEAVAPAESRASRRKS